MFTFESKASFASWLKENLNHEGIWIKFDKTRDTIKMTPEEALDIALCHGWIDGLLKKIDHQFYMKYFAKRRPKSIWSTKNKNRVTELIEMKEMTSPGYDAIEIAKKNGMWDKADLEPEDFSIENFFELVKHDVLAYSNYMKMSPSVQKTYALYYFTAKRAETREKRLLEVISRLQQNLKPME